MPRYYVTIKVPSKGVEQEVTVEAADKWKARTAAMGFCTIPLRGQHVEYDVRTYDEEAARTEQFWHEQMHYGDPEPSCRLCPKEEP